MRPGVMMNTMKRIYKDGSSAPPRARPTCSGIWRRAQCDLGLMIERRFNTMWSSGEYDLDAACGFEIGEAPCP